MALTSELVRNRINGVADKSKGILEVFLDHNKKLEQLVGSDYALGTLTRYKTTYDHTMAFILWKYKTSDVDILKLNYDFISSFEFWIPVEKILSLL
ncbi:phage integrase SAM-like domain-containing protein [Dyadobacter alkalitolerans]|uniref:phage integrase SAM-like domain-containing protein n=1 Tax=Dyadobacter alkalitolerans TaxID=492736 RepID=UPI00047DCAD5